MKPSQTTVASAEPATPALFVAVAGNPNSGKTTLFNALTGLRQKVGNYPGVTVEKKEGRVSLPNGGQATLVDLPGLYSLVPHSPDEKISREALFGLRNDTPRPDVILNVVDASNLERNLYLTGQLLELGIPMVIALTMLDVSEQAGTQIDARALQEAIGAPVVSICVSKRQGLKELLETVSAAPNLTLPEPVWNAPDAVRLAVAQLQTALENEGAVSSRIAFAESVALLMQNEEEAQSVLTLTPDMHRLVKEARVTLADKEIDFPTVAIEARYAWVEGICVQALKRPPIDANRVISHNEALDRILLHPVLGYLIFFGVMTLVFQSIFTWAHVPMDWIEAGVNAVSGFVETHMPAGDLRDLITKGALAGVGATIVFLPQILMLFFFISLLEDTGYMARAAFLMDRLMSRAGLHGKSFIPMLSSFACAIPAVMATRTIGDRKARLITILVAPLMSCSARLPVYTLMIAAFIPNRPILSIGGRPLFTLPGMTLLSMYLLSMAAAFCVAWLFHRTLLKGVAPTFLMELPPYRMPSWKSVFFQMLERAMLFLRRAATLILSIAIVLWFLSTYPKRADLPVDQRASHSFAGQLGHAIEPVLLPLGFDWKMGVGIIASFAAREVFVTAMGTVYNVDDVEGDEGNLSLQKKMQADIDPRTGKRVFTPLVAVSLMVYYVLAMQCMSTIAVVRRETNGWKWPLFQLGYMTGLAWLASFLVYQIGSRLGWGG